MLYAIMDRDPWDDPAEIEEQRLISWMPYGKCIHIHSMPSQHSTSTMKSAWNSSGSRKKFVTITVALLQSGTTDER